ncbi:MAG: TRAP transporter small permease [Agathobaculum sp.]|jgi:TRAP-type C4-dicarboxylate transport system permease small subunit|uniref:TRAP transporter small permease n=1 Tax=Agathobaculum sp. TaxID=2048138 RepID=UPI003D8A8787
MKVVLNGMRKCVEIIIMLLYAILCISTLIGVASRLIPGFEAVSWSMEVSRYSMIYMVMLTNSIAIRERDEIIFEYVYKRLPVKLQYFASVIGDLIILMFLVVMFRFGLEVAVDNMVQISPALGLPITYAYAAMPVGAVVMIIEKLIVLAVDLKTSIRAFAGKELIQKEGEA